MGRHVLNAMPSLRGVAFRFQRLRKVPASFSNRPALSNGCQVRSLRHTIQRNELIKMKGAAVQRLSWYRPVDFAEVCCV